MSKKATRQTSNRIPKTVQELEEAKRILEGVEVKALSSVVTALTEAAESLSRTAKDLADMRAAEWMTTEQAAAYLGCESVEAFVKIAAREGIPKHYLSVRAPRYNRAELDSWLLGRRQGGVNG
jgi:hypothetical protein